MNKKWQIKVFQRVNLLALEAIGFKKNFLEAKKTKTNLNLVSNQNKHLMFNSQ